MSDLTRVKEWVHLGDKEREILRGLEMLSEGGTLDLDRPSLHRVHPGSSTPPGVTDALEADLRPDNSLYAYHRLKLADAREKPFHVRMAAIAEAERDLLTSKWPSPRYTSPDSAQNSKDRDAAILMYEGRRCEEVAVFERCSVSYVRKIRKKFNRDQTWGGSLEGFEITA